MKKIKGPAIFLAQFAADEEPLILLIILQNGPQVLDIKAFKYHHGMED